MVILIVVVIVAIVVVVVVVIIIIIIIITFYGSPEKTQGLSAKLVMGLSMQKDGETFGVIWPSKNCE